MLNNINKLKKTNNINKLKKTNNIKKLGKTNNINKLGKTNNIKKLEKTNNIKKGGGPVFLDFKNTPKQNHINFVTEIYKAYKKNTFDTKPEEFMNRFKKFLALLCLNMCIFNERSMQYYYYDDVGFVRYKSREIIFGDDQCMLILDSSKSNKTNIKPGDEYDRVTQRFVDTTDFVLKLKSSEIDELHRATVEILKTTIKNN